MIEGERTDEENPAAWSDQTPLDTRELALDDGAERLPWLESGEDEDSIAESPTRMIVFALGGILLLAALVFGIYKLSHRDAGPALAEGSVIAAPTEPYKTQPANPGGKPMAGTGDTAYAVSAGQTRPPKLASAAPQPAPSASSAKPSAAGSAAPAATDGPGVQVGAFSSQASAEAAWTRLAAQYDMLKGVRHRVVSANADIGTIYRLQAVPGDGAAANALCGKLRGAGLACQVK